MGDFVVGESRAAGSRVNGVEGGVPEEGDRVAFEWKFDEGKNRTRQRATRSWHWAVGCGRREVSQSESLLSLFRTPAADRQGPHITCTSRSSEGRGRSVHVRGVRERSWGVWAGREQEGKNQLVYWEFFSCVPVSVRQCAPVRQSRA